MEIVKSIKYILKPSGVVFAEIPFLQGYHADPYDYQRYIIKGNQFLFRDFEKIECGVCVGPVAAFCWWLENSNHFFWRPFSSIFVEVIFGWLTFWIRFLDYILIHFEKGHTLAAGLYYIGKRNENSN